MHIGDSDNSIWRFRNDVVLIRESRLVIQENLKILNEEQKSMQMKLNESYTKVM